MSEFYQPGQHPDADQLSAFAEDALPAHEREQTLAHLAGCADCRTIVSLALPPIEDVPQLQPVAVRRPWFYGWNVAWLAGAGLAALIFLTVHVHNGGHDGKIAGGTPTQTAAVHPETAPPSPAAMEPTPANPAPAPAARAIPPPPPPPTTDSDQALQSPAAGATFNGQEITNLPGQNRRFLAQTQQPRLSQQQQSQQQNGAVRGYTFGAGAGTGGVARNNLSPYAQNNTANYNNQNATVAAAAAPAPAAPPLVLSDRAESAPTGAAKPVPKTMDTATFSSAGMQIATADAAAPIMLAPGVAGVQKLPSHLAIASTITRGDQMLALDTAGTLFLSTNGGRQWKTVAAPWPGRAVRVTLASLPIPAKQPASPMLDGVAGRAALSESDLKQSSGPSISGIITDSAGAIVPGVSLRITNTRTGIIRTATSDRRGHYAIAGLTPDAYQIDASRSGFDTQRAAVTLTAAQQTVVNMSLMVGAANETIEVNAESSLMVDKAAKKTQKMAKDALLSEPPAVFEITTDAGEIWTSPDGKSWKRK